MNIFILDKDPKQSARWLCDKHLSKMLLESAQMLCHAVYKNSTAQPPYKDLPKKYHRHPCTLWVCESRENYSWLCEHALEIAAEYTARYDKTHKTEAVVRWCYNNIPNLTAKGLTPFAMAVKQKDYPNIVIPGDPVTTYRNFYMIDKAGFAKWKRNKPDWYTI